MASIAQAGPAANEAGALRRQIYGDRDTRRGDFDMLLSHAAALGADPDFITLLCDVAVDVFLLQADPEYYLTDADAAHVIDILGRDGGIASVAEFAVLKALLGHAVDAPPTLASFALREIEKAILSGRRDALGGQDHPAGVVMASDVEALRAILFAPSHGTMLHVTRESAEALFDIAHATAAADNAPEFADLFAQAIGNYLMGAAMLGAPSREETLAVERELDRPADGFLGFLSAMMHAPTAQQVGDVLESVDGQVEDREGLINDANDLALEANVPVDAGEAQWVIAHLTRGGPLTAAERRLLAFLKEEAPSAPPELTALYDQAA